MSGSASQMASRCSNASLAASPASFQPSNAATTTVLCNSGSALPEVGPSGGVTDLGYGLCQTPARTVDGALMGDCRDAQRNTVGSKLVTVGNEIQAGRVE